MREIHCMYICDKGEGGAGVGREGLHLQHRCDTWAGRASDLSSEGPGWASRESLSWSCPMRPPLEGGPALGRPGHPEQWVRRAGPGGPRGEAPGGRQLAVLPAEVLLEDCPSL